MQPLTDATTQNKAALLDFEADFRFADGGFED